MENITSEKRAAILVRLPKDLKLLLQEQAKHRGVSLNQMINYSLTREVTHLEAQNYLDRRLAGKSAEQIQGKFWSLTEKIQDRPVPEWDQKSDKNS
jgi:hypothetical protein